MTDSGELKTGWVKEGETAYYYNENGQKVSNTSQDIEGKKYFFDENGALIKDTEKDGYTIDSDGVATEVVETPETPATPNQGTGETSQPSQPEQSTPATQEPSNSTSNSQPSVQQPSNNVGSSVSSSAIASAALAQVGVNQDCTMLVTNALASVGINFHGWPSEYASLGSWTSSPVAGDIIIYSGHVAIYIGNGQAVHGGWNGYTTVVSSVNCSNALIGYIHVG